MNQSFGKMYFSALVLLILITIPNITHCQSELFLEPMEGFRSNDKISDLAIDSDGSIWVSSSRGLSNIKNVEAVANINETPVEPLALKITKSGKKIVGYTDNSIHVEGKEFYKIDDPSIVIKDIEIHKQSIYIGTSKGIYCFDLNSYKLKKHYTERNSILVSNYINFIFSDSENRLWIGTKNGIVLQKPKDSDLSKNYDSKLNYIAACENEEGVWLISNDIMWLIESTDNRWVDVGLKKGLYQGAINDITVDKDGSIYIASDILVKFDPYKNLTERYTDILGIASKKCLALEADDNNIIWLGTSDAGLFKIYKKKKEDIDLEDEAPVAPLFGAVILEKPIGCPGEQNAKVLVSVQGGVAPYKYSWSTKGIMGNNPEGLGAGTYVTSITDSKGETVTTSIEIVDAESMKLNVIDLKEVSTVSKKDGLCEVQITGGASPYEITWDNGEQGSRADRLSYGNHTITIVDANGCKLREQIEIKKPKSFPELDVDNLVLGQTLRINKLFFEADSSTISQTSYEVLDEVYDFLYENNRIVIEIGGHTNNIPPHEYCDKLSSDRAEEVAGYLYTKGITDSRISHKGYGKRSPIANNETASGRRQNQRVEIKILKL